MIRYGTDPVYKGRTRRYSKQNGWQTVEMYEGSEPSLRALAQTLAADADDVQIAGDGPVRTLTASYGYQLEGEYTEEPDEIWEFPKNTSTIDILAHRWATALPHMVQKHLRELRDGSLTRAPGSQISKSKDGWDAFHWDSTDADSNIDSVYGDNVDQDGLLFAQLILAGQETFNESQMVITVSVTVSGSYALKMSLDFKDKVISATNFDLLMSPPDDIKMELPAAEDFDAPPSGWQYGYLAQQPDIVQVGGGKWKIVQEFWWGLWSPLYETYTP